MAMPLEVKKANRALFMGRLYDATDGSERARVDAMTLIAGMELSHEQAQDLIRYLSAEGLVKRADMANGVNITHEGVLEVEQSRARPQQPTAHFPPESTVLQIFGHVTGSNIAQTSPGASQHASLKAQREDLTSALELVRQVLGQELLDDQDERVLAAELGTAETQLASPRPNQAVIAAAVTSMVNVLMVVAGDNPMVQAAIEALRPFLPS